MEVLTSTGLVMMIYTPTLVLDTEVAAFLGKGTINLGSEVLDLVIDPDVKKTTISAAVPVNIEGTLANPQYSLDKLAVARKVGGVLGLVLLIL